MEAFKDKYPNLSYLLNCYFYQSWDFEFDTVEAAILYFIENENKDTLINVADDISVILAIGLDEIELDKLLVSSNCCYYVWRSGDTNIQTWLLQLANKLYEYVYC